MFSVGREWSETFPPFVEAAKMRMADKTLNSID